MTRRSQKKNPKQRVPRSITDVTRGNVPPRNSLSNNLSGVTQSLRRTLTYCLPFAHSATASTYQEAKVCLLNSPYDPTIGGSSAAGYSAYMAFYSKCFCLGSRIKTRTINLSSDLTPPYVSPISIGLTITTNATSIGNHTDAVENGLAVYELSNLNPDRTHLQNSVDVAKFLDKPYVLDDAQLFCTTSASPGQVVCAHFWTYNHRAAGTTQCYTVLEIEYDCIFTDPIPFI